jgi:hypothetical protein
MKEILLLNGRRKRRTTKKRTSVKKRITRKRPARKRATKKRTVKKKAARRRPVARRVAAKTKGVTMAKRKRRKAVTRRAPRRNPTRARRATRAVKRRVVRSYGGLNFKQALNNIPLNTLGMFAAKWACKRFGQPATETDPNTWNYASYLKGAAGAATAGFIANMVKRGSGQRVLEGGLSLMLYKLVQNELIPGTSFWSEQLGAADDRVPGTVEQNSAGEPFILGEDYQWYPMTGADDARIDNQSLYGSALVQPGALGFGDSLVEPGRLGYGEDLDDIYARNYLTR